MSDPKNPRISVLDSVLEKSMEFFIWRSPYWIHYSEFQKFHFRIVISNPENPRVESFREIDRIFDLTSDILDSSL